MKLHFILALLLVSLQGYVAQESPDEDDTSDEIDTSDPTEEVESHEVYCNYMIKTIVNESNPVLTVS